jgi:hypothetical protein
MKTITANEADLTVNYQTGEDLCIIFHFQNINALVMWILFL